MTEQTRDQLTKLIEDGSPDEGTQLIATILLGQVLPLLNTINATLQAQTGNVGIALAEIDALYQHLQELAPMRKQVEIDRARVRLQARFEMAFQRMEGK